MIFPTRTFSQTEAAAILGVSPGTLASLADRGLIAHRVKGDGVRLRKHRIFTEPDIDNFIKSTSVAARKEQTANAISEIQLARRSRLGVSRFSEVRRERD
jgi:hypothetical protein